MGIVQDAAQRNGNLQMRRHGGPGAIVIALGSNLGGRAGRPEQVLRAAIRALHRAGIEVEACSRFYRSAAVPASAQPPFVNAVALVRSPLRPRPLLALLHRTEKRFGRLRRQPNAARILDLDLIDYRGLVCLGGSGTPTLPHPRAWGRAFVVLPLAEIAPGFRRGGRRIVAGGLPPKGRPFVLNRPAQNACAPGPKHLNSMFRPRIGSPRHGPCDRGRLR